MKVLGLDDILGNLQAILRRLDIAHVQLVVFQTKRTSFPKTESFQYPLVFQHNHLICLEFLLTFSCEYILITSPF